MVLGGSAPSPYPGHSPASREIQHPAKELNSVCNLKENSCGRELTVTEDDSQSSLIQLFKKKKEARETEKAMAEKEEAFRGRMKVIADRWRDLHAKRAQLKAHVERSGRAVQKHEELRIQALKVNSKQREEKMKKDGELLRVKMELETLRKKHQKLCKKVQKYSIFKKYLEDVVEVSQVSFKISETDHERCLPGEKDISEVTSQYKLLVRTRKDLLQSQQGHKQLTEQDKVLLEQYKVQKEAEMLQYKTELVQLKLRFYQAQGDLPLWIQIDKAFIQRLKDIQFYAGDAEAPECCYTSEDKRDVAA
nr:coiled-coil domain-containing protein 42-like [Taeniopygia guttata]